MLHLSQMLPEGALLGGERARISNTISASQGIWFSAMPEFIVKLGETVLGWRSTGSELAEPISTNKNMTKFVSNPIGAFVFEAGVHCGLCLRQVGSSAQRFSFAVIYSAQKADPRTLLAFSTGQSNNVIFLTETDGRLVAKDRGNSVEVGIDVSPNAVMPQLAIVSYTGNRLCLSFGEEIAESVGQAHLMDLPADFYIGCRSSRLGLTKTLGSSLIHDVFLWPQQAILDAKDIDQQEQNQAVLAALHRFYRVTYLSEL